MLTISGHKGNANQNRTKSPPHPCYNGHNQKHHHQQVLAMMWRKTNPHTLLVGMQAGATTQEKKIWRLLKNLNIDLQYDAAIPLLGYTQRNMTQVTPEAPAHPCLLQHYSQ
jgi:hypothetical protein